MWFVFIGTVLALLKYFEIGPVAQLSWWWVLVPFGLASAWWCFSDATGLTGKREMDRLDARRDARRAKAFEAMGFDPKKAAKAANVDDYRKARSDKAQQGEAQRDAKRKEQEATMARSSTQFGSEFSQTGVGELQALPKDSQR